MKILVIAPHPFYKERGTPIAVKLLINSLIEFGYKIDLLTYHEGEPISIPNLNIVRIPNLPFIKNVPIGFSWKKIVCDIYLTFYLFYLVHKNRYPIIHAIEESVFPAIIVKKIYKSQLIYDMDSSLLDQLLEKWTKLSFMKSILEKFEYLAFSHSDLVLPVCKSLALKVEKFSPGKKNYILHDVVNPSTDLEGFNDDLRTSCRIDGLLGLYVGNLEHYQGIDLMLNGIAALKDKNNFSLVVIGGIKSDVEKYVDKSRQLGIQQQVFFVGPRPFQHLYNYLAQADILISPRLKGKNTPMKIYSYLNSGKPILATNIESHTQILNETCSILVDVNPVNFANGLKKLIQNEDLRIQLGKAGKDLVQTKYSLSNYKEKLHKAYAELNNEV